MNKILKITFFCIIALAIGISLGNVSDLTKINASLNGQLQQQEQTYSGRIDELSAYQETLVERISLLEENYSNLQTAYDELKTAYDKYIQDSTLEREQIQATVVELKGTIATLENNADVDKATISNLRSQVGTLESSLEHQTTTANQLQATIKQQERTIAELNTRIDELIADLNSDLKQLDFYKRLIEGTFTEITAKDLEGVTKLRNFAFYGCDNLLSVELPDCCTSVGRGAFYNCNYLSTFTTGRVAIFFDGMTFRMQDIDPFIEEFNFIISCPTVCLNGCFGYRSVLVNPGINIYYSGTIADWCSQEYSLATSDCYPVSLFCEGNLVEHVSAQDLAGVEFIAEGAFRTCQSLLSIELPNTCLIIGNGAFAYCKQLVSVTFSDALQTINTAAFYECSSLEYISPLQCLDIYGNAFYGCSKIDIIVLGSSLKRILSSGAFSHMTSLRFFYIHDLSVCDFSNMSSCYSSVVYGCAADVVIYTGSTELPSSAPNYWNWTSNNSSSAVDVYYGYSLEDFYAAIA